MSMEINWKKGSQINLNAKIAYDELERIRLLNNGELTKSAVVKASKAKKAPLHKFFEWDDSIAGHKYREQQAGYIIRSIEVSRPEMPHFQSRAYEVTSMPASSENEKPRRVFRTTEDILSDPLARDELLAQAITNAIAYRKRYNALSELSKVFKALDEFLITGNV